MTRPGFLSYHRKERSAKTKREVPSLYHGRGKVWQLVMVFQGVRCGYPPLPKLRPRKTENEGCANEIDQGDQCMLGAHIGVRFIAKIA